MGVILFKSFANIRQSHHAQSKIIQEESNSKEEQSKFKNANSFPILPDGSTYHLNCKKGQVANRILTVGDIGRGERLAEFLDKGKLLIVKSNREFRIWTGFYKEVPVSIAVSLMGLQNMDFLIRETKYCVDGPLAIIRLGTCGLLSKEYKAGTVVVGDKVSLLTTTYAQVLGQQQKENYELKGPIEGDQNLLTILKQNLKQSIGEQNILPCTICTADSFYSSQGRTGTGFRDYNDDLIDKICEQNPDIKALEMENFQLYILSKISDSDIYPAACQISLVNRHSKTDVLSNQRSSQLEKLCGISVLDSLIQFNFPNREPEFTELIRKELQKL